MDDMQVYIANLGKYNEGELVGAWFTFPIDFEEVNYASLDERAQQNILRAAEEAGQKSFPILFQDCAIVQLEDILK